MKNLNQLSHIHYVPKKITKESHIRTQNVPALQMEEAIPIGVSTGTTKSAHEVFTLNPRAMRSKEELTKEEKNKERAHRKRSIKTHLKNKEIGRKEKNREKGIA
jgi:U3 small nucleolar ribonucleoprotein component